MGADTFVLSHWGQVIIKKAVCQIDNVQFVAYVLKRVICATVLRACAALYCVEHSFGAARDAVFAGRDLGVAAADFAGGVF